MEAEAEDLPKKGNSNINWPEMPCHKGLSCLRQAQCGR